MADDALLKHVKSAQILGTQVAAEGRHEDAWRILNDSVNSVMAAKPGSPDHKMLKLAVKLAHQQQDMKIRAEIMNQACDELLEKKSSSRAAVPRSGLDTPLVMSLPPSKPGTPTRRRPATGLSSGGRDGQLYTDPRVSPAHLQKYLHEISSEPPPDGRPPIYRASSAPYFQVSPHAKEPQFSGAQTAEGRVTSHYTRFGAPKSNSHYKNTLAGACTQFDDLDPWKTSNQVFQRNAREYKLDPGARVSRDANFQYVNGDHNQGLASIRQRVRLPAYHRTQAEINGLGMGGK